MVTQKRKRPETSPFLPTLRQAHADNLLAKITEVSHGRRFRYTTYHPAKRIDGFVEERGGTVVILERFTRVRVRDITAVEVRAAEPVVAAVRPLARGERQ